MWVGLVTAVIHITPLSKWYRRWQILSAQPPCSRVTSPAPRLQWWLFWLWLEWGGWWSVAELKGDQSLSPFLKISSWSLLGFPEDSYLGGKEWGGCSNLYRREVRFGESYYALLTGYDISFHSLVLMRVFPWSPEGRGSGDSDPRADRWLGGGGGKLGSNTWWVKLRRVFIKFLCGSAALSPLQQSPPQPTPSQDPCTDCQGTSCFCLRQ